MEHPRLEQYFFGALFIAVLVLVAAMFYPYLGALVVAVVLGVLVEPIHVRIQKRVQSRSISALLASLAVVAVILLPALGIGTLMVDEVRTLSSHISSGEADAVAVYLGPLETLLNDFLPEGVVFDIETAVEEGLTWLSHNIGGAFASTASVLMQLFVATITLYYVIKDGHRFAETFVRYSPLGDTNDREILRRLGKVIRYIVRGTLVIAFLQGLLTGIGFWMFGLSNPALWGTVAGITAIVPTLGTGLVTVPAFFYLVLSGNYISAILFGAWGLLVIGLVDNILRPYLIGNSVHIHPLFILISVLGGLAMFGAMGFIIGPLVLGLLVALTDIYANWMHIQNKEEGM